MKILSILTNILLSILIVLSGTAYVAQNLTQTSTIQDAAKESGIYQGISEVVSKQLTDTLEKEAIMAGNTTTQDFSKIVDEAYVTAKGEELAKQIEDYKSGRKNSIVLDISDISERAKAQGVTIDGTNLQPIEIIPPSAESQPSNVSRSINYGQYILYGFTAFLFVASIIISIFRRRMFGLFLALLVSAIILLLIALSSSLIGSFAYSYLSLPAEVSQLNPYVRSFARALFSDAGRLFLIQGLVLLALSVIAFGVDRFIRKPTATEPAQSNQPTKPEEEQPGHKSEPAEPADTEK